MPTLPTHQLQLGDNQRDLTEENPETAEKLVNIISEMEESRADARKYSNAKRRYDEVVGELAAVEDESVDLIVSNTLGLAIRLSPTPNSGRKALRPGVTIYKRSFVFPTNGA